MFTIVGTGSGDLVETKNLFFSNLDKAGASCSPCGYLDLGLSA
jgi:hypothetical protein